MERKAKRRDSSVKLWKQQSEKRNASESKLNIFTSIQCVVSKGVALGKLGERAVLRLHTVRDLLFVCFFASFDFVSFFTNKMITEQQPVLG